MVKSGLSFAFLFICCMGIDFLVDGLKTICSDKHIHFEAKKLRRQLIVRLAARGFFASYFIIHSPLNRQQTTLTMTEASCR